MPGVPSLLPPRLGLGPGLPSPGAPGRSRRRARQSEPSPRFASARQLLLPPRSYRCCSPAAGAAARRGWGARWPSRPGGGGEGACREGCLTPGGTPGKDPLPFPFTMSENLWLLVRLSLPPQGGCVSLGPVGADQALSPHFAFAGEGRQRRREHLFEPPNR